MSTQAWLLTGQIIVLGIQIYLLRDTNRRMKILNEALAERQRDDAENL